MTQEMFTGNSFIFWAKLPKKKEEYPPTKFHPLLCHLIDVALSAEAMWKQVLPEDSRNRIARKLNLSEEEAGKWVSFLAGLHDLGKVCPVFQYQDAALPLRSFYKGKYEGPPANETAWHGMVTAQELPSILTKRFDGLDQNLAKRFSRLIGGHHGRFSSRSDLDGMHYRAIGVGSWQVARNHIVDLLARKLDVCSYPDVKEIDNVTAMVLAGFVSVADWIGSNKTYFDFKAKSVLKEPEIDIDEYFEEARGCAQKALNRLGWLNCPQRGEAIRFSDLLPENAQLNPMQVEVESLAGRLKEPGLVIIEAPMGEGKTEAAMFLADSWRSSLGQRGNYFALPTQATSNQMFGRVLEYLKKRFPGEQIEYQLRHGHASLLKEFEEIYQPSDICGDKHEQSTNATVAASEWFTHRKRGLLAPFGVGTVDQVLLAALTTPHVFVRLFGLADKTIIIDEVHAYDTYMSNLLGRLLEWLAALGSPVVLLSATLPSFRRQELLKHYARGLGYLSAGEPPDVDIQEKPYPYPCITWVTQAGADVIDFRASERLERPIKVEWKSGQIPKLGNGEFGLGKELAKVLAQGGCAAVICNTVKRAQDIYQALALEPCFQGNADDGLPKLDLFHARFLHGERTEREKRALIRFGKPKGKVTDHVGNKQTVRRPNCAVLVATQVIEQSLDLDFDLMVTDLAPVDLVLQRAGRLHRHKREAGERPPGLSEPTLWVCSPEEKNGVPDFEGIKRVYDRHILLRSWLALKSSLKESLTIAIPGQVKDLIEEVYSDHPCPTEDPPIKEYWEKTLDEYKEAEEQDKWEAENRWLKSPATSRGLEVFTDKALAEDTPEFHKTHQALTRLIGLTAQVICLYGTNERPCFNKEKIQAINPKAEPTTGRAKELLAYSVSISNPGAAAALLEYGFIPTGWRKSPLLKNHRLLTLNATGLSEPVGNYVFELDNDLGLKIITQKQ